MKVWQEPQEVLGLEFVEEESKAYLTHLLVHPLDFNHLESKLISTLLRDKKNQ